jgi:probable F420-dependent oxidoreductase
MADPRETPLGVTYASLPSLGADGIEFVARTASRLGYQSFWTAETIGLEAFSTLAMAGATAPDLGLGTGVLALQLRTPMVAAMGAATLQALHPDQDIFLGVGISSPVVVEQWHGAEYGSRPLSEVREYLILLRQCLSGESVTFDGDHFRCRRFRLGVRLGDRHPKIILGALNPGMLKLAGEQADGVVLNYLPASAVPWCIEQVRAGEQRSGRDVGACRIFAYVHVGVGDRTASVTAAQKDLFGYIVVDAYADAFRRAGFGDEVDAVRALHAERDREGALGAVSDRMVDAIDIVGDAATVRAGITDYVEAGVDSPIVMPLPWGADRRQIVADTLEAAIGGS